MAEQVTLGGSGKMFVGEDKTLRLELVTPPAATSTVAVDMTGWVMVFDVRNKDSSPDPAILSVAPTLSGVFNVLKSANTQRAIVVLTDDQLNYFREKVYRWSWKRMDSGSETVLAWGDFSPQKATAP